MEIRTIRKGFKEFESKFKPFERDSMHSIPNSNPSKGIRSIRIHIRNIRMWFKAFESISNNSNEIPFIWMQIRNIRKGFEGLGLCLGLGPWLGPLKRLKRDPFWRKTPKNYDFFLLLGQKPPKICKDRGNIEIHPKPSGEIILSKSGEYLIKFSLSV